MGTKQLLLITLGIIIVGVAVAVSVGLFVTHFSDQVKDLTIQQMHNISSSAITYWKKPESIGGGGGSYNGFKILQVTENKSLGWKFDQRIIEDELNFFMISKQLVHNGKPLYLTGLHQEGKLVSIKLFDPKENQWQTLFSNTNNTEYTDGMDDI